MFSKIKKSKVWKRLRLKKFFFCFTLRQGTIIIAVQQISLFFFILIMLLICYNHVKEVINIINQDIEDDAELHGFEQISYGDRLTFQLRSIVCATNRRKFEKSMQYNKAMAFFLGSSICVSLTYLGCSMGLLLGAVKLKREYMLPWVIAVCVSFVPGVVMLITADRFMSATFVYGSSLAYRIIAFFLVFLSFYAMWSVWSFIMNISVYPGDIENTGENGDPAVPANDERGERLMLLDQATHSSILSAAQLNKLNNDTQTHFV